MKPRVFHFVSFVILVVAMLSVDAAAIQRRGVVRHPVRRPLVRARLVLHPGHPIRRALPAAVVVRAARHPVVIGAPLAFLAPLAWSPAVITLPARERLVWQDSEVIAQDEGWVDVNFGIDGWGNALVLDLNGKADLNFAEVAFANGNVQVIDFNEKTHDTGTYKLLDFAEARNVKTVRILARSESDDTKINVYLSK